MGVAHPGFLFAAITDLPLWLCEFIWMPQGKRRRAPHSKTLARGLGAEGDLESFGRVDVASAFVEASSFAKAMADETADGDMRH